MYTVIYPYKKTYSIELKYSIKSLKNIKHDSVIVIGDKPSYYVPAQLIPNKKYSWSKFSPSHNQISKYLTGIKAINDEDLILMNDDMYILDKWIPENYNRGTLIDHIKQRGRADSYSVSLKNTMQHLDVMGLPTLSYEVHTPFIVKRDKLELAIDELLPHIINGKPILIRSYYGNRFGIKSTYIDDCKNPEDYKGKTLLSTDDQSFTSEDIGEYIRGKL